MKKLLNLDNDPDRADVKFLFLKVANSVWFSKHLAKFRNGTVGKDKLERALEKAKFRKTPRRHPGYATVAQDGSIVLGVSGAILQMDHWSKALDGGGQLVKRIARPLMAIFEALTRQACGHELIHAC